MSSLKKITILELTPCIDTIYHIRSDPHDGYAKSDGYTLTLHSGVKLRPRTISTHAGGKSTNVARVLDQLLTPSDDVQVELVSFRPDTPEGHFLDELLSAEIERVRLRTVEIKGTARFCIDLTDPESSPGRRAEFNISPRVLWERRSFGVALNFVRSLNSDLVVLAGNPPALASSGKLRTDLYRTIMRTTSGRIGMFSIDAEKETLAQCLSASRRPDLIKVNRDEYHSVEAKLWKTFRGMLIVTDAQGCSIWENGCAEPGARLKAPGVGKVFSSIGAGDAFHAGFLLARFVRGLETRQAISYAQAVAAAVVTSPEGTCRIRISAIRRFLKQAR